MKLTVLLAVVLAATPAAAKQVEVKMLNRAADGSFMAFEPAFVAIEPGDTVKFVATDKGHNAESIPEMTPAGATPFKGRINQEIVVTFDRPGLYGYKCLPHVGMGMVGLVRVGDAAADPALTARAGRLPGLAKKVMGGLLAWAR